VALPTDAPLEDEPGLVPGYRNYLVFCDDSGLHGSTHYGFGSLWIPEERRGDIYVRVRELRQTRRLHEDEIKWTNINRGNGGFYLDLVREFFERPWLMFHCLVVRRAVVDKTLHKGSYDLARRKHFAMLLRKKIALFSAGVSDKAYHVRVDKLPSSYPKADEAAYKIVNAGLNKEIGVAAIHTLLTRDSKLSLGIQLADVLLGAVMSEIAGDTTAPHKLAVRKAVAEHLGWPDLHADTDPAEWKFNIWRFWNPKGSEPREAHARPVTLKIPMPRWKPRATATGWPRPTPG
jgi:hypothetical protein